MIQFQHHISSWPRLLRSIRSRDLFNNKPFQSLFTTSFTRCIDRAAWTCRRDLQLPETCIRSWGFACCSQGDGWVRTASNSSQSAFQDWRLWQKFLFGTGLALKTRDRMQGRRDASTRVLEKEALGIATCPKQTTSRHPITYLFLRHFEVQHFLGLGECNLQGSVNTRCLQTHEVKISRALTPNTQLPCCLNNLRPSSSLK